LVFVFPVEQGMLICVKKKMWASIYVCDSS
jgi:hypothetical protein